MASAELDENGFVRDYGELKPFKDFIDDKPDHRPPDCWLHTEASMTENGRHKGMLSESLHKELRVVISGNRSPLSFRIAKWALFLSIAWRLYRTRWFRLWVLGLPTAGLATHLLYRRMTHGWTRPWGGWKDLEAGRPRNETWKR